MLLGFSLLFRTLRSCTWTSAHENNISHVPAKFSSFHLLCLMIFFSKRLYFVTQMIGEMLATWLMFLLCGLLSSVSVWRFCDCGPHYASASIIPCFQTEGLFEDSESGEVVLQIQSVWYKHVWTLSKYSGYKHVLMNMHVHDKMCVQSSSWTCCKYK